MTPPISLTTPGGKLNLMEELYRGVTTVEEFNERTLKYVRMIQGSVLSTADSLPLQWLRHFEWAAFEKLYRYGVPYDLVRRGLLETGGLVCGGGVDKEGIRSELCLKKEEASHFHDWSERSVTSVLIMVVILAGAFFARMTLPNPSSGVERSTVLSFPLVIIIDFISMASLAIIPVFSYMLDIVWAPLAALLTLVAFQDWRLGLAMLIKELLPVIDFLPLATIIWMFRATRGTVVVSFLLGTIWLLGTLVFLLSRSGMLTITV